MSSANLAQIYVWIHRRAEFLRQQKAAAAGQDSEAQTQQTAAKATQAKGRGNPDSTPQAELPQ
jgi:hypothetical protein